MTDLGDLTRYSIVLADDHASFREGLRDFMGRTDDILVVGEACSGTQALEITAALEPDLLVLDMSMPDMSGMEVASRMRRSDSPVRVLPLSGFDEPELVLNCLTTGTCGYLLKDESLSAVLRGVRTALGGGTVFSKRILERLASGGFQKTPSPEMRLVPFGLTPSQVRVLMLLADGFSNPVIASTLHRSIHTVRAHLAVIRSAIGIRNRASIVAWYWRNGFQSVSIEEYRAVWRDQVARPRN